jgi:hypothetical protein
MSESMVERVAKAILEADVASAKGLYPDVPESVVRIGAEALFDSTHRPMAIAAIEAMRAIPTATFDAAYATNCIDERGQGEDFYRAVIDTALTETGAAE